jgi:Bacterial protein of unknown function (DUF882)
VLTPLAFLAVAIAPLSSAPAASFDPTEAVNRQPGDEDPAADRLIPPLPRELSKKESWRLEKATRRDVRVADRDVRPSRAKTPPKTPLAAAPAPVGATVHPITTLFNLWTKETLPIVPGETLQERFHPFLRDHFTNQATRMDVRLIDVLAQVARKFRAPRIEVVSGYRSPKYNLMLRKKGHQVARQSQHMEGHAVDFRIRGVPTRTLLRFVRSLRRGGVGYYPESQFVHSDTGRIRFWRGS